MEKILKCPGLYCGRVKFGPSNFSSCGACPRGYRVNYDGICILCDDDPVFYDWLYITFMVFILVVIQWYITDQCIKRRQLTCDIIIMHFLALIESVFALIITLIIIPPIGYLSIKSCSIKSLSDWYTLFFNPSIDFKTTIRCTQEAAFPFYTLIFIFYIFSLVLLLIRPLILKSISVSSKLLSFDFLLNDLSNNNNAIKNIYLTLYVVPGLMVVHALFSGLIYYSFPFIILIGSFISVALHLAFQLDQRPSKLFASIFQKRNFIIMICHWIIHTYGIVSLTEFKNPVFHSILIGLVPIPTLFYILTSKFTDPNKLNVD